MQAYFPRNFDALEDIFAFSASFFERHRLAASLKFAVDVALEELVTNMIKYIGESRGTLGAQINGLQATYDNLSSSAVAYEQSASKIGDANYARETTQLAAHQILTQAATSILAQANARSSTVLTLLK